MSIASSTTAATPDLFTLDESGRITLEATDSHRYVVTDDAAGMFAAAKGEDCSPPKALPWARTYCPDWLRSH